MQNVLLKYRNKGQNQENMPQAEAIVGFSEDFYGNHICARGEYSKEDAKHLPLQEKHSL